MNIKFRTILMGILILMLMAACSLFGTASTPYVILMITSTTTEATPVPFLEKTASSSTQALVVEPSATPPPPTVTLSPSFTPTPTVIPSVTDFPDPTVFTWQPLLGGLSLPVALTSPGDHSGRIFIVEKSGRIIGLQDNASNPTIFLDIQDRVGSGGSEQGLLGLAFSPQYAQDGIFYVDYTDLNGNTVIARYHVSQNADQGDAASEEALLHIDQPFANHNGGQLAFGPDGYLYIGMGDGGSAGDPHGNGQSLDILLGKILRIDVSRQPGYTIPPDNPFADGGGKPEIWLYGLRNPWRFSFDHISGDLYIGDVGQDRWEEVDFLSAGSPGGENLGWNYREGLHAYAGTPPVGTNFLDPVFEYGHDQGCSISGGYVYRGSALPEWEGVYLFADYCKGTIWGLLPHASGQWNAQVIYNPGFSISSFGQDDAGELYILDYSSGQALKLVRK
jgi:glucose/arabinose dehydrogenase